ncbi:MAG: acyl-CoA dehydrogenase family protein, partial [Alphaproteobacteria bacterium]|nr:acyl-CoA dehydrogenase family protein [Alphaproteobacteria bacterium]
VGVPAMAPNDTFSIKMVGNTLVRWGTEAQKRHFLPRILSGADRWCQGYSEPGAGSDLASLRTQCIDKGDHFLVNGSKIWTSGAQFADMCFALVRTDNTKKHEGISFLLIDMKSPGVEVRPIKLISGNSPFCETFFTDVKVPKENLMGPLNGGWTIGKRLLQFERAGLGGGVGGGGLNRGGETRTMDVVAKHYVGANDNGQIADADLRTRITNHLMDQRAFMMTIFRAQAEAKGNQGPSATTSIMKNAGSRIGQERAELLVEVMGHQGLGWEGEGFTKDELDTVRGWLGGKATTIYGGSQEIQNNIIAKRILGLLDHQ